MNEVFDISVLDNGAIRIDIEDAGLTIDISISQAIELESKLFSELVAISRRSS